VYKYTAVNVYRLTNIELILHLDFSIYSRLWFTQRFTVLWYWTTSQYWYKIYKDNSVKRFH